MQTDCISFREVPGTSRLFSDYLSGAASALAFYARPAPLEVPVHEHSAEHRARIADILLDQNRKFGGSAATLANIERLRNGASFKGPAIIEQGDTTTVVEPGMQVNVDEFGNLIITP